MSLKKKVKQPSSDIPVLSTISLSEDGRFLFFPQSVAILGQTSDGKILLVEQYRELLDKKTIELPGGKVEPGELLEDAAARELREESGYECINLSRVFSLDMDLSLSRHVTHIFHAELRAASKHRGTFKRHIYGIDKIIALINKGLITHAPTVSAIYWFYHRKTTL